MIAGRVKHETQIGIMIGDINSVSCGVHRIAARLCPFARACAVNPVLMPRGGRVADDLCDGALGLSGGIFLECPCFNQISLRVNKRKWRLSVSGAGLVACNN